MYVQKKLAPIKLKAWKSEQQRKAELELAAEEEAAARAEFEKAAAAAVAEKVCLRICFSA